MWRRLRALFPSPKPNQLTISSHGQETCNLPFDQIREAMEWLGLSLITAGYQAQAHIVWDDPNTPLNLKTIFKGYLRRDEPTFLYRCGVRPMQPPSGCYWRLMPEYPNLRMYQLERKGIS